MGKRVVYLLVLIIFLTGVSVASTDVRRVEASGYIYIRADGRVEGTTSIVSGDNVTYVFTADISGDIVVERSNVIVDGNGYTLSGGVNGFYWSGINNVTIKNTNIKNFASTGILLKSSSGNTISGNNVTNNYQGIIFAHPLDSSISSNNTVSGNCIANNNYGVLFEHSSNNTISGNNITATNQVGVYLVWTNSSTISGNNIANNGKGVVISFSCNDRFWHNNFVDNGVQVASGYSANLWDDGVEGNYWSNYTGVDLDHDGIGDSPHVIDANNTDNYPLMGMFYSYDVLFTVTVTLVSNSTVSNFRVGISMEHPENRIISFNVTGETGYGFCRVCVPKAWMNPPYTVIIDNGETLVLHYNETIFGNGSHRWIYFAYQHSEHQVEIIPEFPQFIILPLFMMATLLAGLVYRRKKVRMTVS